MRSNDVVVPWKSCQRYPLACISHYHTLEDAPDTFTNANGCLGLSMYAADTSDLGKEGTLSEFCIYS